MSPRAFLFAAWLVSGNVLAQEETVRLHAAGSLRAVMTEMAQSFRASGGGEVKATFGASGLLRTFSIRRDAPMGPRKCAA